MLTDRSFWVIGIVGITLRLLASVYSTGYAMHDDHFVIEDGPYRWQLPNYGDWFNRAEPPGHSVVYPALMYGVMSISTRVGVTDPMDQMFVMRIIHGLWSMVALPFIWLIAMRYAGRRGAVFATLLYSTLWILPFMSVRNLIEMVSIPPLMMGWWFVIDRKSRFNLVLSVAAFALAFCFRYHTALIAVGVGVGIMVTQDRRQGVAFIAVALMAMAILQSIADILAWGYPLAGPIAYVAGFFVPDGSLPGGPWYSYPALLLGVFLPPASLLWLWTVIRTKNREMGWLVAMPTLLFLAVHMMISNKQERFVLPIIAITCVIAAIGIVNATPGRFQKVVLWYFGAVNLLLLVPMTLSPSKNSRVEVMYRLRSLANPRKIAVVGHPRVYPPTFYAGHNINIVRFSQDDRDAVRLAISDSTFSHVVCFGEEADRLLWELADTAQNAVLIPIDTARSKGLDQILHTLNPHGNRNEDSFLYEIRKNPAQGQ